ncbi:MAG: zinc-binding alcohol dehydrogenase family protein [Chloroflexi bacterium]|nr:zinc-binding alcohol dehydrogenase family protein [Chloroflexota bacterium]MCL5273751.1 zinc-binding alcohol dehydrogenase family protein [Chloroflexota bacterium]
MKTVILDEPFKFSLGDTDEPGAISAGEALVRVHRVGICGSDIHAYRGRQPFFSYPRIIGHELGVEIVEIGANERGLKAGDRCSVEPYLNCGHCIACRHGKSNCCTNLQVLGVHTDGGMREFIKVPITKLHKSEKLTLDQLALVETLGIGSHAVDRAMLGTGEFALVIGAGPIGLSVIQFAKLADVKLIVLDINEQRLEFARRQFGVDYIVNANDKPLEKVMSITGGDLPTVVFDATGSAESMMGAFQYVAHGCRLVFVGLMQGDITFNDPFFHRREMTLYASRNSLPSNFTRIIALMEEGRVNTAPWITHRASYADIVGLFPSWLEPQAGLIKGIVEF